MAIAVNSHCLNACSISFRNVFKNASGKMAIRNVSREAGGIPLGMLLVVPSGVPLGILFGMPRGIPTEMRLGYLRLPQGIPVRMHLGMPLGIP